MNAYAPLLQLLFGSGLLLAVLGGLRALFVWLTRSLARRRARQDTFPFKVILPQGDVLQAVLGGDENDPLADRHITYQRRVRGRDIEREVADLLETQSWVLLLGRTGLGKTREAVQLAQTLNKQGWTVLKLTREDWLDAPPRLPRQLCGHDRKLLFLLDDLNRKMHAGRVELSPRPQESLGQSLTEPLQHRLRRALETYEALCGKNEVRVLGTARNETAPEYPNEPSEWGKLQTERYKSLWDRFATYELPVPDDAAIAEVLKTAASNAHIPVNDDAALLARSNDGTFANVVENLRSARNTGQPISLATYRETLKGTWQRRYSEATSRHPSAKYVYQAIALLRQVGIELNNHTVQGLARFLPRGGLPKRVALWWRIGVAYRDLVRREGILTPRDGQIETAPTIDDLYPYIAPLLLLVTWWGFWYWPQMNNGIKLLARSVVRKPEYLSHPILRHLIARSGIWASQVAQAYQDLGSPEEAVATYRQAIRLEPKLASAHYNLACLYVRQGRFAEARQELHERIRHGPDNLFAPLVELGIIGFHLGQPQSEDLFRRALAHWQTALDRKHQSPSELMLSKALALLCLKHNDEAMSLLSAAIAGMGPTEGVNLAEWTLVQAAPSPPHGIDQMVQILKEFETLSKRD